MRLSEAIRLGAMIRPKPRGRFSHNGASCAQGAALEAQGLPGSPLPDVPAHPHRPLEPAGQPDVGVVEESADQKHDL